MNLHHLAKQKTVEARKYSQPQQHVTFLKNHLQDCEEEI